MSDTLSFTVVTYTPFRVATGSAQDGADAAVDRQVPVPGSTVKGLMRDAARELLGGYRPDHPLVVEVFGDEQRPHGDAGSPWHWEDVAFAAGGPLEVRLGNRIRIDGQTRTVLPGALLVGEEVVPTAGTVEVWRSGRVPAGRVPVHRALLLVSAALVDGLGSDRRAGNGWVSLTPADPVAIQGWEPLVDLLLAERSGAETDQADTGTAAAR